MENSKLMTPLFYDGMFNRNGHKMRSVLEREISDSTQTYRLWCSAGRPDVEYPRAENDKYILYVEINGYLATLGMTDFTLTDICGFEAAAKNMYGGKEKRGTWIDQLRESGGYEAVSAAIAEERKEIERCGCDPARQSKYIQSLLGERVSAYLKAKENGGQTFPDFIGALVLNELPRCVELSAVYKAKCAEEQAARAAQAKANEKEYYAARNQEAERKVSEAVQIILSGGVLKNETVTFYRSRYDSSSYSVVNYLMRRYQVDVPLRTQGWINDKLYSATVKDGKCENLQYYRKKNGRVSQKFFECMNAMIRAVTTETPKKAEDDAA